MKRKIRSSHKIMLRNIALFNVCFEPHHKFLQKSVLGKFISSIYAFISPLTIFDVMVRIMRRKIHSQHCIAAKFISSICVYIVLVIVWSGLEPQVCTSHCQWEGTVGKSPIVKQFTRTVKTSTKPTGFDLIKKSKLDAKVTSFFNLL